MTPTFRLVVFDWDGTLMDSTAHITRSIQRACADLQLPIPSDQRAKHVIGLSLEKALSVACPEMHPNQQLELINAYRRHFFSADDQVTLFDGVKTALAHYHQRPELFIAIATGKSRVGLDRVLQHTELTSYFPTAATRTVDECASKPNPQMLLELMDYFGVAPHETLMVGDTTHDLTMAQNAHVHAVGLCGGAHTREALSTAQPLACFETFTEFDKWLRPHLC